MKELITLSLVLLVSTQQLSEATIVELIDKISESSDVEAEVLKGRFSYYSSDEKLGIYKSTFVGDRRYGVLNYISDSGAGTLDSLYVGDQKLSIAHKYNPLSTNVYSLKFKECEYICLIGKAISANGSGVQVTYYTLLELNENKGIISSKSFESRFGIIQNLGDHNKDGKLDYLKVINGDKMGKFLGKLYDLSSEEPIGDNYISLNYLGSDNFEIMGCNWFKPIGCN